MTKEENALLIAQKEYDKTLKNSPSWEKIEQESDDELLLTAPDQF